MNSRSNRSLAGIVRWSAVACFLAIAWGTQSQSLRAEDADALHEALSRQADAWNRGDIETFMDAYWKSPRLTFSSGGEITRGWEETLARYRKRYPDGEAMGKLTFSELETELMGPDVALTLGRWALDRKEPARGNFTLVWRKLDGTWRIVHDHSSSTKSP